MSKKPSDAEIIWRGRTIAEGERAEWLVAFVVAAIFAAGMAFQSIVAAVFS